MSTAIAFLSAKGGSGKTTLALSVANLLCGCDVKTLLVDCDLSTNGATYFYESQLAEWNKNERFEGFCFDDLLNAKDCKDELVTLKIRPRLDFIPSISEISGQHPTENEVRCDCDVVPQLQRFLARARHNYDVILFDCQAGYSEFLPALLPLMDIDLFILEADSISASAMRSLHLKIGNYLGHAQLYQIFNKATSEEFDIYSKIVGTFFVNIGTLRFDWKIRQAFSRSQTPDLENTSAQYGSDLCDICKILLPEKAIRARLEHFSAQLRYQRLQEEREQAEQELCRLADNAHSFPKALSVSVLGIFLAISMGIFYWAMYNHNSLLLENNHVTLVLMLSFLIVMIIFVAIFYIAGAFREVRKERRKYERKLKELDKELGRLDRLRRGDKSD